MFMAVVITTCLSKTMILSSMLHALTTIITMTATGVGAGQETYGDPY